MSSSTGPSSNTSSTETILSQYTRSREYHKNDNGHVEGKNWTIVQQYLGYDRFENQRIVALMNNLYCNEWRLLLNFFLPSVKLKSKQRSKSKIITKYDPPKTILPRSARFRVDL